MQQVRCCRVGKASGEGRLRAACGVVQLCKAARHACSQVGPVHLQAVQMLQHMGESRW